jgi:histidyl-tRNA synthetase
MGEWFLHEESYSMAKFQAPSGFRDFLPGPYRKRSELIRRIRDVYESFGYEGIETPAMENLSVFLGKGGGENEKLMFRVLKRGAELQRALEKHDELADLALRFDLTVPLARYFATHRGELPTVFKRYHIGPVWRAERAQHGRFREFIQCDVDVLGSASPLAEADVILATATALAALGFTGLTVRLNSRPLLGRMVRAAGVPEELVNGVFTSIDKLDKVPADEVKQEMLARGVPEVAAASLLEFAASAKTMDDAARLAEVERRCGAESAELLKQLREVVEVTPALPSGKLVFDPFLARGMDYYTGPIFEVAAEGVPFSLAGGGRYDELVGVLSGQKTPAVGFSIGFERVYTLMDERRMFSAGDRAADVLVTVPQATLAAEAVKLAAELRVAGLRADLFPGPTKLPQQFALAEKKGIPFAATVDADEAAKGVVTFRDLATRQNEQIARAEAGRWLKGKLSS